MNLLQFFNLLHTMIKFDFRKLCVGSMVALGSVVSAFAEETGSGSSFAPSEVISNSQEALSSILSSAGTSVAALVAAGLAIWGAIAVIGVLKRAFNAGKGR